MSDPKLHPHENMFFTAKEIARMKECSVEYVNDKLNRKGWTVAEVMSRPIRTASQRASKGASASPWGAANYNKAIGGRK